MITKYTAVLAAALSSTAISIAALSSPAWADAPVEASISATATTQVPALFAKGDVRIAVVRQLNTGDVYENWIAGIQAEAKLLGVHLQIYNANGDSAKEALYLQEAVSTKPNAIIVGWGFADSLQGGLDAAQQAHIPVIAFDVGAPPSKDVVTIQQSNEQMMQGILAQLTSDLGGQNIKAQVLYAYVPGYRPLDLRNNAWQAFLKSNPGVQVKATIGVVDANTATETANQAVAALTANPQVTDIIAPYDEFAKGATLAVQELKLQGKVKVYGMDISTADIAVMTAPDSPWVVTATTDMVNVGAVVLRTAAAKAAGQLEGNTVTVPPAVITQAALRADHVQNMDELRKAFPQLMTPDLVRAPWMAKGQ